MRDQPRPAPARLLEQVARTLMEQEIGLVIARMKAPVSDRLEQAGAVETIGRDRLFPTVPAAVAACARSE